MSDAIPLPPRPRLDQYRKLAKDFHAACRSTDPLALRQWAGQWITRTLKRQHLEATPQQISRQIAGQATRLEQHWQNLDKPCTLAAAQFFLAREHGFASWPRFAKHIQALAIAASPVSAFEAAADAIITGNAAALRTLLQQHPGLVRTRSLREHRSTLLHYVSANGVEDFRQITPPNIVAIATLLLDAGAEINAESDAYGGGSTTLGLVATSVHPERAGVQMALLQTLLDRGAETSPSLVNSCFANGQPAAAQFLASVGAPIDLEGAAALGMFDVVKNYFHANGQPLSEVTRQQAESAFLNACGFGHAAIAKFLLDQGIPPTTHNKRGQTGLHWAVYGAHIELVKLLLEHHATVHAKDHHFHATPLDTALWVWNTTTRDDHREHCYEIVALLACAGAALDPRQWQEPDPDPDDGAGLLEKIDADPRMRAALEGKPPTGP